MRRGPNPDGNERLTAAVGLLLLVPIAVELATIVLGVHSFMSLHVFVGLALIPPVLLKLGSTGWRFARYYTRSGAYLAHGAPQLTMRLLAPLLVVATVVRDLRSPTRPGVRGAEWRSYAVAAALVLGLLAGALTIPSQHRWVDLPRDHDRSAGSR